MHLTDIWKTLTQKNQEKILRENNFDSLHKPKGFEIDRMLKNVDLKEFGNEKFKKFETDFNFEGEVYGPGDIPL